MISNDMNLQTGIIIKITIWVCGCCDTNGCEEFLDGSCTAGADVE